jgi:tRNA-dihydrouridine synthase 4
MSARGLLENPALFDSCRYETTPVECVKEFVRLALGYGMNSFLIHHHLMDMLDKTLSRAEKKQFNDLSGTAACIDYLEEHFGIEF